MALFKSLRERISEDLWFDLVQVPLKCAIGLDEAYNIVCNYEDSTLSRFIEDRTRRLRQLFDR